MYHRGFFERINLPVRAEQLVGEVLYGQERAAPIAGSGPDPGLFSAVLPVGQGWRSFLTEEEAVAVSAYRRKEARWLDLDGLDSVRTACETGDQYGKVKRLGRLLSSACSRS